MAKLKNGKTGNYNTTEDLDKPLFVYAVYYNINGKAPIKVKEEIDNLYHVLNPSDSDRSTDYREVYHIIPVKDQETKIELLYPRSIEYLDTVVQQLEEHLSNLFSRLTARESERKNSETRE